MKKILTLICIVFLSINALYAQSNNDKARAYFNQAKSAYGSSNYAQTITYLNSAEQLLGSTNPVILNLKVKAYYNLGQYNDAKKSLAQFSKVSAKADSGLVDETVAYIVKIDNVIAEEKEREEQARLAEIQMKEEERLVEAQENEKLKFKEKLKIIGENKLSDEEFTNQLNQTIKGVNDDLIDQSEMLGILGIFGGTLKKENKLKKSIIVYKYLVDFNSMYSNDLAESYFEIGDYEKSEEYYNKIISLNRSEYSVSEAKKQLKLILETKYNNALKKDPRNPELNYNLGVLSAESNDLLSARKYYEKTISLDPNYVNAYINLAAVILQGENKIINEMNSLGSSKADNKRYDVLKDQRLGIYRSAAPYLEKVLEIDKGNRNVIDTLLNIYSALGKTRDYNRIKKM